MNWYAENQRALPWRLTKDPYRVWLSEIILQQTRVAQGLPYYERFITQFPTLKSLAEAPQQKILRIWQGLGYYSRARNLHTCARQVVKEFDGKFPQEYDQLLKLKGIGPYTAAAIASIAFDKQAAVVDGNVYRVLSRVFGIQTDISSTEGKAVFSELANRLIDKNDPGAYNQAIMEFGALFCTPKNPDCGACIFRKGCVANLKGLQGSLPYKARKTKVRNRYFNYVVIRAGKKIAMRKRNGKDIWSGLYDFYLSETNRPQRKETVLDADVFLQALKPYQEVVASRTYKHVLSHQVLKAQFVLLTINKPNEEHFKLEGLRFYSSRQIQALPKPVLVSRFLAENDILE